MQAQRPLAVWVHSREMWEKKSVYIKHESWFSKVGQSNTEKSKWALRDYTDIFCGGIMVKWDTSANSIKNNFKFKMEAFKVC